MRLQFGEHLFGFFDNSLCPIRGRHGFLDRCLGLLSCLFRFGGSSLGAGGGLIRLGHMRLYRAFRIRHFLLRGGRAPAGPKPRQDQT